MSEENRIDISESMDWAKKSSSMIKLPADQQKILVYAAVHDGFNSWHEVEPNNRRIKPAGLRLMKCGLIIHDGKRYVTNPKNEALNMLKSEIQEGLAKANVAPDDTFKRNEILKETKFSNSFLKELGKKASNLNDIIEK